MDVGLNNTNLLHLVLDSPYMEDVEWIVEATSEEKFHSWQNYHKKFKWEEISAGKLYTILEVEVAAIEHPKTKEILPVTIEFSFAIIDGHKICFYSSPSRLSHHGYINAFLITYFQRTHHEYSRWNHTDATNFHNCINYLNTIDIEPRSTEYKPESCEQKYYIFEKF